MHTLSGVTRAAEITSSRVSFEGKPAVQFIARDISERKRAREREGLSRRLEALGTLAGGVAHDFNNILAAIRINLDLMKREFHLNSDAQLQLHQVEIASERATAPAMIELRAQIEPDLPPMMGDPARLHQVLINLLTNARHAIGRRPGLIDFQLTQTRCNAPGSQDDTHIRHLHL